MYICRYIYIYISIYIYIYEYRQIDSDDEKAWTNRLLLLVEDAGKYAGFRRLNLGIFGGEHQG